MNRLIVLLSLALAACGGADHKNLFTASGDIGSVGIPGNLSFVDKTGEYTLTGAGINMWNTEDAFFMTWREATGDFSLSADAAFEGEGVNLHRKMGLIVRDGLAPDAVYADIAVHGDGLTSLQYRPEKGATTLETVLQPTGGPIPGRITLERRGDRISIKATGLRSETSSGEIALTLPETCFVGLFVCSHETDVAETARFSDVTFSQP